MERLLRWGSIACAWLGFTIIWFLKAYYNVSLFSPDQLGGSSMFWRMAIAGCLSAGFACLVGWVQLRFGGKKRE